MFKKKLSLLVFTIVSCLIFIGSSHAASLSLSKSAGTVSVGQTVKITARISGGLSYTYSNFAISYDQDRFSFVSSSDNCNGLNCLIEGNSSVTLTFKAKTQGSGTFKASGSFEDDNAGSLSASTSVTVGEVVTPKNLSSNNFLKSLSVEGYSLNPEFNKDKLEYSLDVAKDVTSVTIKATAEDSTAKITGVGEVNVTEGINTLNVVVSAENGSTKTYVIKVNVAEKDPIKTKINGSDYTVVRNKDSLTKPENYEEKTIKIDGKDVPAFYNEITKFTLVGLKDDKGNINLYVYDKKENKYTLYQELKTSGINFYPMDGSKAPKGYKQYTIDLNGVKVKGFKISKDSNYAVIYGMDLETGKKGYYMYDIKNNTLQLYNEEHINLLMKKNELYSIIILASWAMLFLFLIIIITLCAKNSKRKKKIKNILERLGNEEEMNVPQEEEIVDEEQVVDEVIENEEEDEEEMYNIMEERSKKEKKSKKK